VFGFLEVWIRKEKEHLTELQKTETNDIKMLPVISGIVQYLILTILTKSFYGSNSESSLLLVSYFENVVS